MNEYYEALPPRFDADDFLGFEDWSRMDERSLALRKEFGFAIPSTRAINTILALGNEIVEIGAGSGYWAHLLTQRGAIVHAYDNGSWEDFFTKKWFDVKAGGPEKVRLHHRCVVLLVWPPYNTEMALEVADLVRPGQHLVYIGESRSGCNGTDGFFARLEEAFEELERHSLPSWRHLHDDISVHRRKK